jgi:hypothetical protein
MLMHLKTQWWRDAGFNKAAVSCEMGRVCRLDLQHLIQNIIINYFVWTR